MSHSGRIARLCNQSDSPELNGLYVTVVSSNKEDYEVLTLVPPNNEEMIAQVMGVSEHQLDFLSSRTFATQYPNATELADAICAINEDGRILDISSGFSFGLLGISGSALIRGEVVPFATSKYLQPKTTITFKIIAVDPQNTKIIEFEDIHFCSATTTLPHVLNASVTFRRCRFTGSLLLAAQRSHITMVFESCLFENITSDAVSLCGKCTAVFWNCYFCNLGSAVRIEAGGRVEMVHCTMKDVGVCGVASDSEKVCLEMAYCLVQNSKGSGVVFTSSNSTLEMNGCRLEGCKEEGLLVGGIKQVDVCMVRCVVADCGVGIYMIEGKVDVRVTHTSISRCSLMCVFVAVIVMGSVVLTQCNLQPCLDEPTALCFNLASRCELLIDGVELGDKDERAAMMKQYVCSQTIEKLDSMHLQHLRAMKKATSDGAYVRCANCHVNEPLGERFKTCSNCRSVCYCSRECQVGHWKEHKNKCV